MTDIIVRRLQPGDEATVCRVVEVFHEATSDTSRAATFLANPANYLLIAETDNTLVGFLMAYRLDRIDRSATQLFVYEIDVEPEYQRRGAGSTLMRYVADIVDREGMMEAFVITNRSNVPAMALFQRTGGIAEDDDAVVFAYPGPADTTSATT